MGKAKQLPYLTSMKQGLTIAVCGFLLGMLIYLYITYSEAIDRAHWMPLEYVLAGLSGILVCWCSHFLTIWLNQQLSWKRQTGERMILGILCNFVLAFGMSYLLINSYSIIISSNSLGLKEYVDLFVKLGVVLFVLVLVYSVIYFALHSYQQYAKNQIAYIETERKQIDLQLRALKAQLSPHFLFNSLNTISSLVNKDVEAAEFFIRQLAQSYQYTLNSYEKKLVSLEEELAFVASYQHLLKTRFEDYLQLDIAIPDSKRLGKVPPLSIQLLVENAAKHNRMDAEQPLRIEIGADENWVWVRNNKTTPPEQVTSFHIGLENIKKRYRLLVKKDVVIIDQDYFMVKLPLLI